MDAWWEDTTGDGIPDHLVDDDGDGIVDVSYNDLDGDGHVETIGLDTGLDGIADRYLLDSDGDGRYETTAFDTDQDGDVETAWIDVDGDGWAEVVATDEDVDGRLETVAVDSDRDGVHDQTLVDGDRTHAATETVSAVDWRTRNQQPGGDPALGLRKDVMVDMGWMGVSGDYTILGPKDPNNPLPGHYEQRLD